jgi:hypothetical protein
VTPSFAEWKPEVDSLLSSFKLELNKLNSFDCDAKAPKTLSASVLPIELAIARSPSSASTDGPAGRRIKIHHRDCGSGVFTHIHDPVKGTVHPQSLPPKFLSHIESMHRSESFRFSSSPGQESRSQMGKLHKINFPKFEGDNPKLWQSRCENYFEMYSVD